MWEVVNWLIIAIITHLLDCYVFCKLQKEGQFKITRKMAMIVVILSLIECYTMNYYEKGIRSLLANIDTIILLKVIYDAPIIKALVFCIFSYIFYAISEVIAVLMMNFGLQLSIKQITSYPIIYVVNLLIFVIYLMIFSINKVKKFIKFIIEWYKENKILDVILMSIVLFILVIAIVYPLSFDQNTRDEQIILVIFFISSIIFVSGFFKQKSSNNELQTKYEAVNEYLKTHERLLAEKSREQHEHKNQLVLMRDMVHKNNRKLLEYIDKELKRQEMKEEYIYIKKLKNIPEGGLKGLIHYKIESMLESKLEVYVDVSSKLSKKSRWKNLENDLRDISMSLGVYIDNAIEAAKESKGKSVMIEVEYEEGQIIFEISNTYQDGIKGIGEEGYTTKGIGRGQGLTLVKEIIDGNKRLKEQREIQRSYYVQKLIYDCQ